MALTDAERQQRRRDKVKNSTLVEVRNIFVHESRVDELKAFAEKLQKPKRNIK